MAGATRAAADPPRVLHVMDKLSVGGSSIAGPARLMSYYLAQRAPGNCVVLLCSLRREDSAKDFLTHAGVDVVCLDRGKYDLRILSDLQRLAARWRPSLLHLHGYASWTFGRIVGRQRGIPVVLQEHFVDDRVPLVQQAADWALRRQQQFAIAVSGPARDFMFERRYLADTPVEIVWNAVPSEAIAREAARADTAHLRKSLGIPARAPVVGIVARLSEEKGHEYFLDIGARVAAARPDAHFVIVGDGPRHAITETYAARLGLGGRTHFAGYQDNVVPWLSLFSVNVMTSRREGFPAVPLESLAAGTPVVMTDLDVFRGVYTHERDVLKIPSGNADAAADAVLRLLQDEDLVARLAENARQLMDACSVESIVPKYAEIYRRLLRQGSAA
ncbi:MAG TPA: glycosyltransferase family 4 protein [Woeseiaceae bacterium]|nr:glycosyltransferase family 4 protein [Woeseiaceae bacterium]